MSEPSSPSTAESCSGRFGLGKTVVHDVIHGDLRRSLRRDLADLFEFYLDEPRRRRFAAMGRIRRAFGVTFWLLKNMLLKLSPARRVLLVAALVPLFFGEFTVHHGNVRIVVATSPLSFLLALLVLMLELKDKLLAREELEVGRAVQIALLPPKEPEIPGWDVWLYTRPANDVGGDLVDYIWLAEDRIGVALGDVAGKGLGAALLMAKLQSTVRALASGHDSLAELGAEVNHIFCRDSLRTRFATLLYAELRPHAGEVRLLNAGHMPPLSINRGVLTRLPPVAPALGLMKDAVFVEQSLKLDPGGMLLLYSDGLSEAFNARHEAFGDERLRRLLPDLAGLPAEAVGRRLLEDVDRHVGDARSSDDLSLIVLRRLPA